MINSYKGNRSQLSQITGEKRGREVMQLLNEPNLLTSHFQNEFWMASPSF